MNDIETRIQHNELQDHLDSEVAADLRAEAVDREANFLMEEGQEFHPFGWDNFCEAMQELGGAELMQLEMYASFAAKKNYENEFTNRALALCLTKAVTEYWRRLALMRAEKNV